MLFKAVLAWKAIMIIILFPLARNAASSAKRASKYLTVARIVIKNFFEF